MAHFRFRRSFGNVGTRRFRGARPLGSTPAFSPEATNYFSRLDAAGDTTYVDYKQPLANYIDSLVSLGGAYWDDMLSSTSFVGVGIEGVTVPLRDGMTVPTQNNFVVGDLDQLTGLESNGSTKYIDTGLIGTDLTVNDASWSLNLTSINGYTSADFLMGSGGNETGAMNFFTVNGVNMESRMQTSARSIIYTGDVSNKTGFIGVSRSSSAEFDWQFDSVGGTNTVASQSTLSTSAFNVFGISNSAFLNGRLATYHIGPAIDLATLEGLQATLLSEIRTAHTFVAAASYFSRLAAAGDTTHVAYKQPLTNYITSLVELGGAYWDDMLSAASFVGVGIQGVTVPLRDGMPSITNNNFVAGDLNPLTGLKGDGSTKRIDALPNMSGFSQDDVSMSAYQTELLTDNWLAGSLNLYLRRASLSTTCFSAAQNGAFPALGLSGTSRSSSAGYTYRTNGINEAKTATSAAISDSVFSVVGWRGQFFSNGRVATYHAGPALDLTTLEGLQDTLITEIAAI